MDYQAFNTEAAKRGFRIRVVPENHINSLRISTHLYNNFDEVDRFVEVVRECLKG